MTTRVIIVSENASLAMGGEASRPLFCFQRMSVQGVDVRLVCHARVREELQILLTPEDFGRVHLIEDSWLQAGIWRLGLLFPYRVRDLIFAQLVHLLTQLRARKLVRSLVREHAIDVVYEPSPNTPRTPSCMFGLGAPVVIGPLCGDLSFPPGFRWMDSLFTRVSIRVGRRCARSLHWLARGKLEAAAIIVANDRTAHALPGGHRAQLHTIIESGVDLDVWRPRESGAATGPGARFVYAGRFVDWKGVEYLVRAFEQVCTRDPDATLDLVGAGELEGALRAQVNGAGLADRVRFLGWKTRAESAAILRDCDVFVMPSLRECGGTALLEAMALGIPVVAVNWGGPGQIVDESCGCLVEADSRDGLVKSLAAAMTNLSADADLRARLGDGGIERVRKHYFNWDDKIDRITEILREVTAAAPRS